MQVFWYVYIKKEIIFYNIYYLFLFSANSCKRSYLKNFFRDLFWSSVKNRFEFFLWRKIWSKLRNYAHCVLHNKRNFSKVLKANGQWFITISFVSLSNINAKVIYSILLTWFEILSWKFGKGTSDFKVEAKISKSLQKTLKILYLCMRNYENN